MPGIPAVGGEREEPVERGGACATMVQAETHMPQPMHSMAGSIRRRSGLSPPTAAKAAGDAAGVNVAPTAIIVSRKGAMSTTRSRIRGKW